MRSYISLKSLAATMAVVAMGLGLGAGIAYADKPAKADKGEAVKIGEQAPAFTLTDQNGKTHNLADYEGKVVVIEQFNDGCPYVEKFYKNGDMNRMAEKYTDKGVVWLAVNSTSGKDQAHNKDIAGKWNIDRPVLADANGQVGKAYGMKRTPEFRIIGPDGRLLYKGGIDSIQSSNPEDIEKAENYVAAALDEILAGETVSKPEAPAYGCTVKY